MRAALGYDRSYTNEMLGDTMIENKFAKPHYLHCTDCGDERSCAECGFEGMSHGTPCRDWHCQGTYSH